MVRRDIAHTLPDVPTARLAAGTRVYAIGDSHGCLTHLQALHEAILADAAAAPAATRRVVVYLGDYVDRGPASRELLEALIEAPLPGFEGIHLLGNHDLLMREVLAGAGDALLWLGNGGEATLRSYGVGVATVRAADDRLVALHRALAARVPESHRRFLDGLRLSHVEGDYLFVHAGIRPGLPLADQSERDLLWIREPFLSSTADHGKIVVHGHTPDRAPQVRANRIGIDTGACYGGRLTALVLDGDSRRFLRV